MKILKNRDTQDKAARRLEAARDFRTLELTEDGYARIHGRAKFHTSIFGFFSPHGRAFRLGDTVPLHTNFSTPRLGLISSTGWIVCGTPGNVMLANRKHPPVGKENLIFFCATENFSIAEVWLSHMQTPISKLGRGEEADSVLAYALTIARKIVAPDDTEFADAFDLLFQQETAPEESVIDREICVNADTDETGEK